MKKTISILVLGLLCITNMIVAQTHSPDNETKEKIKAEKVAFFTKELDLSVAEAQKFWPLYNEYEKKQDALHSERRSLWDKNRLHEDELSDEEMEKILDRHIEIDITEAQLRKEYHEKFKSILPVKKVAQLYHSEFKFKKHLLKEIRKRHRNENKPEK